MKPRVIETRDRNNCRSGSKPRAPFFAVFDRLAFPTGFKRELTRLREGDLEAIELAVRFLEADPWYFRSGYNKAEIIRHLRKHTFTEGQSARLRKVIHERVLGRPVREMRSYAQLASKISNPAFEALLKDLAASSDHRTARHATWILTAVKNANVSRRNT